MFYENVINIFKFINIALQVIYEDYKLNVITYILKYNSVYSVCKPGECD